MALPESAYRRVPAHAWSWLQRSRDVLAEIGARLYGEAPPTQLIEELRRLVPVDPFVRGVVLDVIRERAFHGRPPDRRPHGASWDRGLVWWAAALNGVSTTEFEAASAKAPPAQPRLFGQDPPPPPDPHPAPVRPARPPRVGDLQALADSLRSLLAESDGDQVPAEAIRRLLRQLEQ
ncbi:MAG: hypothetical protein ACRDZO_29440 [Egibacteraceae bacterium]